MKGYIPYEKALEILEKIDDSYFSEEVVDNDELLDEVWQMLWLAGRLFESHLDICGPQGDRGPVGTDAIIGQLGICGGHPDPAGAPGKPGEPIEADRAAEEPTLDEKNGEKGKWVLGRFLPLDWIQQYEKREGKQ